MDPVRLTDADLERRLAFWLATESADEGPKKLAGGEMKESHNMRVARDAPGALAVNPASPGERKNRPSALAKFPDY